MLKCWHITNADEYVIAYVYASSIGKAKVAGLAIDPSGEAEFTSINARRCQGLDGSRGSFNLFKVKDSLVVDIFNSDNRSQLLLLNYAIMIDGDLCFNSTDKPRNDEVER